MSSPSKSHHGFRNAIRIRRNSGASNSRQQQQQPQHAERGPFELQVVERAVRDEQEEIAATETAAGGRQSPEQHRRWADDYQGRRGSAPDTYDSRPGYSRRPSMLEQLVRQDRQSASSSPQTNTTKAGNDGNFLASTSQTPANFSRLNTARSRDTVGDSGAGLGVLHEGDESGTPTVPGSRVIPQYPHSSYGQGATLSPSMSAPLRNRPEMVHTGPSSDRARGLAPGPRLTSPSTRQDDRWQPALIDQTQSDQQQPSSHGAEPSSSSEGEEKRTQTPSSQDQTASKPGIFSSLMRRGRSYTLPSLTRTTSGRPDSKQGTSPKLQQGTSGDDFAAREREDELQEEADMHEDGVVDYLDVVDAEVGVLNHMSNIQNSIFIPHIPALYDRRTTHALPVNNSAAANRVAARRRSHVSQDSSAVLEEGRADHRQSPAPGAADDVNTRPGMMTRMTSALSFTTSRKKTQDPEAFQHFSKWADMDENERHELDEHVQFLLTRPQKFRRGLRGFGKWAMTPMGFIMLCYGIAITGWGIVIMLFIWKWIDLHDAHRQRWWIEICDQVLCALFAAVGLGFAPFRAVDTWRMCHIAHYHHLSWKRRKQYNLPKLHDPNDLPRPKGYNETFPPPAPLDLITEEESEMMSPSTTTRNGSAWNLNGNASGPSLGARSSREEASEFDDRTPYEGRTPGSHPMSSRGNSSIGGVGSAEAVTSPGTRSRSSTTTAGSSRPSALAQAISNANPPSSHRWWQVRPKRDKEQSRNAAAAAMQAVENVSPRGSSQAVDQQDQQPGSDTQAANGVNEKDGCKSGNGGPPQSRPQLRGGAAPPLQRNVSIISELEKEREDVVVLTPEEQAKLNHHQRKFHQSHTFYRYHETATHRAFPLDLMIVIVCLLDCHSLLQGSLGGVTWGIRYQHRPTALTASLITCSLSCNAVAGFLIYLGGRRTKKTEEVQRRLRIALEEEAYRDMLLSQKRREEEAEMRKVLDGAVMSVPAPTHRKSASRTGRTKSQTHSEGEQRNSGGNQESSSPTGSTRALL